MSLLTSSSRQTLVLTIFAVTLLLSTIVLFLVTEDVIPINLDAVEEPPLLVFFMAVALALLHLAAPRLRRFFSSHETIIRSLGGGMAIAYAFLMLFPELERGHELLGDSIEFLVLAGFLLFFALEVRFQHHDPERPGPPSQAAFRFHLILMWLYNWVVVYALPEIVGLIGAKALISTTAIGLHMMYKDFVVASHHQHAFDSWGRFVLASTPLIGWASAMLFTPSEALGDLLIALLAGYLLQNVFRNELPSYKKSSFLLFVAGVMLYSIPVVIYRFLL